MNDKKFFDDIKTQYKEEIKKLNDIDINIVETKFILDIPNISKYSLNDDVIVCVNVDKNGVNIEYYYNGLKIEPKCYYLRPEHYYPVETLTILHECIYQDTHEPDIKFLEDGKKSNYMRKIKLNQLNDVQ